MILIVSDYDNVNNTRQGNIAVYTVHCTVGEPVLVTFVVPFI